MNEEKIKTLFQHLLDFNEKNIQPEATDEVGQAFKSGYLEALRVGRDILIEHLKGAW